MSFIALSSAEDEYVALSKACQTILHIRHLLKKEGQTRLGRQSVVWEDNRSAILRRLAGNKPRTKHIDVKYYPVHVGTVVGHMGRPGLTL